MTTRSPEVSDVIPMQGVEETDVQWITPVATPTSTATTTTESQKISSLPSLTFTDYKEARAYADTYLDIQMALDAAEAFLEVSDERLDMLKQNEKDIKNERASCSSKLPRIAVNASYWGIVTQEAKDYVQECIRREEGVIESTKEKIKVLDRLLDERRENHREAQFLLSQKKLPTDVWMEIFRFYLAVTTKLYPSRLISHVCRFWRFVVLQNPLLWSKIIILKYPQPTIKTAMSTYLSRTANISKLSFTVPQSSTWRFRFTSFAYEINTTIQDYYDSPHGEPPEYAMYSFGNVDSLRLETASLGKDPYFFISNWAIRQLECENILPVLAPSSASYLVKLSLTTSRWPSNNALEKLLQLTSELQDLTIDYRWISPIPEISFHSNQEETEGEGKKQPVVVLLKLHAFQTTLPMLFKYVTTLASSPALDKIGILPTETPPSNLSPYQLEQWQEVLSKVPGLIERIRHFAVLPTTTTMTTTNRNSEMMSRYFQHGCLSLLLCFPNLDTIELNDAVAPEMLFAMWGDERFRLGGKELILRNCLVKPVLLFQIAETSCTSDGCGKERIRRVVLDRCEGITRAQCERLKELVGELVIYC